VGYAYKCIEADEAGAYLLALGSDDGVCIWLNGEKVFYNLALGPIKADQYLVPFKFKKGKNHLLVKVEQGWGGWGFIMRFVPRGYVFSTHEIDIERMKIKLSLKKRASEKPEKLQLFSKDKIIAEAEFPSEKEGGLAEVDLTLPFPPVGEEYGDLRVVVDGREACTVEMPSFGKERMEAFKWQTPIGDSGYVFSGTDFPKMRFERPLWIESLIGPYELSTTFYDADYNKVTSAEKTGRYGAVVDIKTPTRTTRRFVTLYRQKKDFERWQSNMEIDVKKFPEELGISDTISKDYSEAVSDFARGKFFDGLYVGQNGSELLCALKEAEADGKKAGYYTSPELRDREWWLPLKRKLYGYDKEYPKPFISPVKLKGKPSRVIRKGSLKEAGFKEGFVKELDEHLTKWSKDTDEAFGVIVVRHGVIAFHKAYGERDGKPMTLETKSWMASTTKMMSGTLMMMLVDQGLINLDDRADKYLPPLKDISKPWPATIRNLYRHSAGMSGHWGSWMSDMEYRVADLAPHYECLVKYEYDGAGLDLSCKILELISGETLPQFFQNHLLRPLGCENTDVNNASGSAQSVPLDMAKVAQMLLQKGKYGNMQFFSEDTFKQMLPQPVTIKNPPWDGNYGIGTGFFKGEGLGEGTFAHGAASQAFTRIDPVNDMVIIMTRNRAGSNFDKYKKGFFKTIVDNLVKEENSKKD
jgi:CubicO group peptidase (beta-lactamase class C family)